MDFTVRTAREDDAEGMLDVLNPIIGAGIYTIMDQPFSVEEQIAYIRTFPERGVFHVAVATDTGRILGLQSVEPVSPTTVALQHVGDISTFVALDVHRAGIGQRLTAATLEVVRARGYRKILAMIRADNPQAVAFYQRQGFGMIGTAREHALVQGRYVDEVLMERFTA